MSEPKYLTYARSFIGTKEIRGNKHNPIIIDWLIKYNAWWRDDETPWCGVFVNACLREYGYRTPKLYMRAKAWLDYGYVLDKPCLGCIVIFGRKGGGHVGFVVGENHAGNLLVLGGNQGNEVNIKEFDKKRVLGYRLPTGYWLPAMPLPKLGITAGLSTNEA